MRILAKIKSFFSRRANSAEKPPISVVLLLNKPAEILEDELRQAAARAWGREFDPGRNEFIVLNGPLCFLTFEGRMFHLIRASKPYFDDSEAAARATKDMRQQKVIREQVAWASVDLLQTQDPAGAEKNECYRRICSLAAELLDDSCLAVYFPETGDFRVHDSALRKALLSDDPRLHIQDAEDSPVISAESDDAEMEAAMAEARYRWPEFVEAFRNKKTGQLFLVKAPFSDGENKEWMWVTVSAASDYAIAGKLENQPVDVQGFHKGDHVELPSEKIADWIYEDRNQRAGGFTNAVLTKSLKKKPS
jgi:uncharacterized protein YegJ (DUF2314 family)